ncbi:MAG: hypothetical protein WCJ35_24375, partial [Planctomycetota bacterium]
WGFHPLKHTRLHGARTHDQTIINRLKKQPKSWERIDSVGGIKRVACRYAETHALPFPPKRQAGRPKKKYTQRGRE